MAGYCLLRRPYQKTVASAPADGGTASWQGAASCSARTGELHRPHRRTRPHGRVLPPVAPAPADSGAARNLPAGCCSPMTLTPDDGRRGLNENQLPVMDPRISSPLSIPPIGFDFWLNKQLSHEIEGRNPRSEREKAVCGCGRFGSDRGDKVGIRSGGTVSDG